jgi:hypothetical protein
VLLAPRDPAHTDLEVTADAPRPSAPARPTEDLATRLAKLEQKYRHELLPEDKRLGRRERIVRLRRKLGR